MLFIYVHSTVWFSWITLGLIIIHVFHLRFQGNRQKLKIISLVISNIYEICLNRTLYKLNLISFKNIFYLTIIYSDISACKGNQQRHIYSYKHKFTQIRAWELVNKNLAKFCRENESVHLFSQSNYKTRLIKCMVKQ